VNDELKSKDALIKHLERCLRESHMTMRDQFAMSAMSGLLSNCGGEFTDCEVADAAYRLADVMVNARS